MRNPLGFLARWSSLPSRAKLLISHFGLALLAIAMVSVLLLSVMRASLMERGFDQFESVQSILLAKIGLYFEQVERHLTDEEVKLRAARAARGGGEKPWKALLDALVGSPVYQDILDVALLDTDGKVVRRLAGDEALSEPPRPQPGQAPYSLLSIPAGKSLSCCWASVRLDGRSGGGGTLAVLLSNRRLNELVFIRTGYGGSGESYLVDKDFRMRTDSRFLGRKAVGNVEVRTKATLSVLEGKPGKGVLDDYRGIPVLSIYGPLPTRGLGWTLLSEIDVDEVLGPVDRALLKLGLLTAIVLLGAAVGALLISRALSAPIERLAGVVEEIAEGRLPEVEAGAETQDEVSRMRRAVIRLRRELERKIAFSSAIGERRWSHSYDPVSSQDALGSALVRMRSSLEEAERLRQTSWYEGQEQERARVATELHDGIGQLLTVASIRVGTVLKTVPEAGVKLQRFIGDISIELKRIANGLSPTILDDFGLGAALYQLTEQLNEIQGGEGTRFEFAGGADRPLPADVARQVYRIAQELTNNVLKHAQARVCWIEWALHDGSFELTVEDDGKGFPPEASPARQGHGLRNIQTRVETLGGQLGVERRPEGGARFVVTIPKTPGNESQEESHR